VVPSARQVTPGTGRSSLICDPVAYLDGLAIARRDRGRSANLPVEPCRSACADLSARVLWPPGRARCVHRPARGHRPTRRLTPPDHRLPGPDRTPTVDKLGRPADSTRPQPENQEHATRSIRKMQVAVDAADRVELCHVGRGGSNATRGSAPIGR
jgi:hypothetical protein